jgi:hypothetical protein
MNPRIYRLVLSVALLCDLSWPASPRAAQSLEFQVTNTDAGTRFSYSIPHPESVRTAWIEVLDQPLLLDRKDLSVQATGELVWTWDSTKLGGSEQPEDQLVLSINDPDGETIFCEGTTMMSRPGGQVSPVTIGGREKLEPDAALGGVFVRVAQGSPAVSFTAMGANLTARTVFHAVAKDGAQCSDRSLSVQVLDLAHATVTLSGDCLRKPGVVYVTTAEDNSDDEGSRVYIASRKSPVLSSASPAAISTDLLQDKLTIDIRGRGFTKDSTVYAGYQPHALFGPAQQLSLETEYLSSTHLRARIEHNDGEQLETIGALVHYFRSNSTADQVRIWVVGSEDAHELSAPHDIELRATPGLEPRRPTSVITSVSPFPIRLMNEHSPREMTVTIRGENFVPENKVVLAAGSQTDNEGELRSEFVSPHLMRAWIPRQRWRRHHVIYRLVVETVSGKRVSRQVEDESYNDNH